MWSAGFQPALRAAGILPARWKPAFLFLSFLLLYFYVDSFRSTFIDDAFIQFKYADTLVRHGNWGFFSGKTTNTATSPLNVLVLSLFTLITGSVVTSAIWLTTCLLFCLLLILQYLSSRIFGNSYFGWLLFVAVAANPLLLSCLGMETMLFVVLFFASLTLFFFQKWYLLAANLALLTLARPDGFLLFLILALLVMFRPLPTKTKLLFAALYAITLMPWHLYSWIHLGSFLPDTLIIKTNQQAWYGNVSFGSGLGHLYFVKFSGEMLFSLIMLPFALLAFGSTNRSAHQLLLIGITYTIIHFIAYSVLKVPPYHWYYAHLAFGCALAGSIGIACLFGNRRGIRLVFLLLPLAGLLSLGFPFREAPIHTNWATHDQYKEVGEWLRQNTSASDTFVMGGEIGTLAYYADRTLLNNFSDAWNLQRILNRNPNKDSRLFKLNYYWRKDAQRYPRTKFILEHVFRSERTGPEIVKSWPTACKWVPKGRIYLRTRDNRGS
ncbi:hypothetical protein L0222_10860 [bacterium]|nr:hypothetical protein [bacterium]